MDTDNKFGESPADQLGIMSTESFKLSKMSKGYNWEIKMLEINVDRMVEINDKCIERWGSGTEKS